MTLLVARLSRQGPSAVTAAGNGAHDGDVIRLPDLGKRGQGWVWLQALLMAAIPTVGGLAPPWPAQARIPMLAVGMGVVLLACTLLVAGILGLGASFAVFPEPTSDGELVTTGIYGRARHPIFGGWILVGLGFGVAFSPWALPLSGILALELLGKTSVEERHLIVQYPAYVVYRVQVPRRFFPVPTWK